MSRNSLEVQPELLYQTDDVKIVWPPAYFHPMIGLRKCPQFWVFTYRKNTKEISKNKIRDANYPKFGVVFVWEQEIDLLIKTRTMTDKKLKVALIDDHRLLTTSLSSLLSKYDFIESVTVHANPKSFLKEETAVDIIISDLMMPEMSGMDLLNTFRKQKSNARVILLSSVTEVQTIRYALRNGAYGYLSKDSLIEEVADAILTVYNGDVYIGESLRNSLLRNSITEDRMVYTLSPREKEVLIMVCSGKTIKETAYDMGLSANTVQTYYKTIMKKFGLNRTADLIVFAIRNGLYNPSGELPRY